MTSEVKALGVDRTWLQLQPKLTQVRKKTFNPGQLQGHRLKLLRSIFDHFMECLSWKPFVIRLKNKRRSCQPPQRSQEWRFQDAILTPSLFDIKWQRWMTIKYHHYNWLSQMIEPSSTLVRTVSPLGTPRTLLSAHVAD